MTNLISNFADVAAPGGFFYTTDSRSSEMITIMIFCLLSTILIETLLSLAFKVRKKNLWIVILAQVVTNPLVVLVPNIAFAFAAEAYLPTLLLMEVFAVVVEWLMYKYFFKDYAGHVKPFILSLVLNAVSFLPSILFWSFTFAQVFVS